MKNSALFSVLTTSACMLMALATSAVLAGTHQHKAHVHGEANLNIVIDQNNVLIELESPAANLLGFEHTPHTSAEKQQLKVTQSLLSEPSTLLSITNNQCQLVNTDIELPFSDHDDHHSDHSEIHAEYTLQCQSGKAITLLSIQLFSHFPDMQKLTVMWIKNDQQGSVTLTPDDHQIILPE